MIPLAHTYQPHLAVLFLITSIPIIVHSYAGLRQDDCADLAQRVDVAAHEPIDMEQDQRVRSRFDAFEWWQGRIAAPSPEMELRYVVIRSFNAKRLYYRPDQRYLKAFVPESYALEWIPDADGRIPIHRAIHARSGHNRQQKLVAYLLAYEKRAISNGYLGQLRHAPLQMLRGSRPMTLFMVWGHANVEKFAFAEQRARAWLGSAWQTYRDVCGG